MINKKRILTIFLFLSVLILLFSCRVRLSPKFGQSNKVHFDLP